MLPTDWYIAERSEQAEAEAWKIAAASSWYGRIASAAASAARASQAARHARRVAGED